MLGTGKRLFAEGTGPGHLRVTRSQAFSTGVVFASYDRAGDIEYGSFALE
jgi:hypothetical protein